VLESEFIKSNQKKWSDLESDLKLDKADYFEDFNQLSDDSSFSQTYYKNRSIRVYLNQLMVHLQSKMLNKRGKLERNYGKFWFETIPQAMYYARKTLLISFLVFLVFTGIGYYSASQDANFTREVFGNAYVTETIKNIEKGDPMAIYKNETQFKMFLRIAQNNIRVGLFAFALGCLFGIGSLFTMLMNGIMIGAFMYFFYSRGLATDFNLAVWMHGTFEIAMLIIEATAGFVMGLGLVNKGNYTTLQSFYISSRNGIYILIATVPFTIFAAFIESYLTRYTEIPNALRAVFIISCLLFTLYYFVIYPIIKHRRGAFINNHPEVEVIDESSADLLHYRKFRFPMTEAINAIRPGIGKAIKYTLLALVILITGAYFFGQQLIADIRFGSISGFMGEVNWINTFLNMYWLPNNTRALFSSNYFLFSSPVIGLLLYTLLNPAISSYTSGKSQWKLSHAIIFSLYFILVALVLHYFNFFFALISLPFVFAIGVGIIMGERPDHVVINAFKYGMFKGNNWIAILLVGLVTLLLAYLLHSPLFWSLSYVVQLFYLKEDLAYSDLIRGILLFMAYMTMLVFVLLYYMNVAANYLYNKEMATHEELRQRIDQMEVNKQILGFEVE